MHSHCATLPVASAVTSVVTFKKPLTTTKRTLHLFRQFTLVLLSLLSVGGEEILRPGAQPEATGFISISPMAYVDPSGGGNPNANQILRVAQGLLILPRLT